jgi:hypothetical protein
MKDIEEYSYINGSIKVYSFIDNDEKVAILRITCRGVDDNITKGKSQIMKGWLQHFDHLLNININTQQTVD